MKLGILAIAFVVAMAFAVFQSVSKTNQLTIVPTEKQLTGIAINQQVADTQAAFEEFYLAYAEKQSGNGSLSKVKETGETAFAAKKKLEELVASELGLSEDGVATLLAPLAPTGFLQGAMNEDSTDSSLETEFDTLFVGFGTVATSVGQRTNLYRNENTDLVATVEAVYGDLMPAKGNVTSLVGMVGGGADPFADLGEDDEDTGDDASEADGDRKFNVQTSLTTYGTRFERFSGQLQESKSSDSAIKEIQKLALPLLQNYAGDSELEGNNLRKQSADYIEGFHKQLKADVETRLSAAKNGRLAVVVLAGILGLGGLAGFVLIIQDIGLGISKALNVSRAIARDGDLSVGTRYSEKRGDELGDLLDEMAHMCQSLDNTATAAESIASGDLKSASIAPRSEQDRMGKALLNMVDSLRDQIGETKSSASRVAETAKNILAATSQVAATANQMATSISEATTTAEEVRQTANLAEQKAKSVAQSAGEAASVSVVGQKQTQMTLDEMEKIRKQMETIAESIVRLSEQGQAIGDIITTVNDIAEQSNVLAVNASIEAAKAGEHGRGFAVVAQEVKSLADESKTATSAIRAILSDIERATASAVMLAEQGTKSAQVSVDRSKEAGTSIKDLGTRVVQAAQSSAQISASASQQLAGVDQVVDAMVSIKDGSSQIVDSVSQVKSSAEELSALSATLQKNIQSYQV